MITTIKDWSINEKLGIPDNIYELSIKIYDDVLNNLKDNLTISYISVNIIDV